MVAGPGVPVRVGTVVPVKVGRTAVLVPVLVPVLVLVRVAVGVEVEVPVDSTAVALGVGVAVTHGPGGLDEISLVFRSPGPGIQPPIAATYGPAVVP